jgi:sugar/nucleoside kinase (ribokinase family)
MLDVIVRPLEEMQPTSDTASQIRSGRGGSSANIAVALAHQHDVVFVGARGDDHAGMVVEDSLRQSGVTPLLQVLQGSTGVVVALVGASGERAMLTDRGVNPLLSKETVVQSLDTPFDHLHVSGYVVLDEGSRPLASLALRTAQERGASTSVDVCSIGPLVQVGADVFRNAIGRVTMLFANEEEALALANASDVNGALSVLAKSADEVVITRGAQGAVAFANGERYEAPAQKVTVLDTTGAGDSATGAFLSARLHGENVDAALEAAMAAGSKVIGSLGTFGT